jgi:hypothetical protein
MAFRAALFAEVVVMAFDTVRTNKMRSFLTVLGVVIGITSIVGMTAMIRGFDQSLRDLIAQSGPDIVYLQKFGVTSFTNGAEISKLLKRPDLTLSDSRALEAQNSTLQYVDIELGAGPGPVTQRKVFYRNLKTKNLVVFGTGEFFAEGTRLPMLLELAKTAKLDLSRGFIRTIPLEAGAVRYLTDFDVYAMYAVVMVPVTDDNMGVDLAGVFRTPTDLDAGSTRRFPRAVLICKKNKSGGAQLNDRWEA